MQADLLTLAQQCETAGPEGTRGLLERARKLFWEFNCRNPIWDCGNDWQTFDALLDINTQEAFLGAAMMLRRSKDRVDLIDDPEKQTYLAYVGKPITTGKGQCSALALLSAILRAEAAKQEKG